MDTATRIKALTYVAGIGNFRSTPLLMAIKSSQYDVAKTLLQQPNIQLYAIDSMNKKHSIFIIAHKLGKLNFLGTVIVKEGVSFCSLSKQPESVQCYVKKVRMYRNKLLGQMMAKQGLVKPTSTIINSYLNADIKITDGDSEKAKLDNNTASTSKTMKKLKSV